MGDLQRLGRATIGAPVDRRPGHDRAGSDDGGEAELERDRRPGSADGFAGTRDAGGADDRDRDQCAGRLAQGVARPVDQLAHGAWRELHRAGDLLVAPALELALDDRLALGSREIPDRDHQGCELLAALKRLRRLLHAVVVLVELLVGAGDAVLVDRRVANDPEEPGADELGFRSVLERDEGLQQRFLNHVLGARGRGQRAGESGQRLAVAADDLIEGRPASGSRHRHQALIGLRAQQHARKSSDPWL